MGETSDFRKDKKLPEFRSSGKFSPLSNEPRKWEPREAGKILPRGLAPSVEKHDRSMLQKKVEKKEKTVIKLPQREKKFIHKFRGKKSAFRESVAFPELWGGGRRQEPPLSPPSILTLIKKLHV